MDIPHGKEWKCTFYLLFFTLTTNPSLKSRQSPKPDKSCVCHYSGHGLAHDHLALNQRHHAASAVLHRSQPRSTSDISHATWTVNTSWRYSPSMATWSPSKCHQIATIPSSHADMLTSILSRLTMLKKQSSTWMAVGHLVLGYWGSEYY